MGFLSVPNTSQTALMSDIDMSINKSTIGDIVAYEDIESPSSSEKGEDLRQLSSLASYIEQKFILSKARRYTDEQRWLEAYRNYRGEYGPDVQFTDTEKSRVFIKITKTKVNAAYSKITEVLFSGQKFPIGVQPTPVVDGVAEAVYFDPQEKAAPGQDPNESTSPRASTKSSAIARQDILELVGPYKEQLDRVKDKLKEGYGNTPTSITFEPAVLAAKNAEKRIHDQLEESQADIALRSTVFEMCTFGSGAFKGPFAKTKEYPRWNEKGDYDPIIKQVADVQHVSIWNLYPDPDARNITEMETMIERHRMSRSQLRSLKKRPYFRDEVIEKAIEHGSNYIHEWWEDHLTDKSDNRTTDRWEVLEFWGVVDAEIAKESGLEIPELLDDQDQIQVNAWICNGEVIRLVLNPFNPVRINYYIVPYEHNPYSIFGIGVAENMSDTQLLMNGFMRLAVDNAALSSNVIFEVDETNLAPGQDMKLYPGKVFRRQGGAPGQAIFATKFPNVTNECLQMFDKARQVADEATGLPSYSHGQTDVNGVGRTASGMSMLMSAAAENIKAVVRNIDDYLLAPLGKNMFAFNMQFSFDPKELGDVEVVAKGTESLMRNEIRSQKILQFLQITANPMDAAFVKRDYLLRELANSLDIDADKAVNDPREAGIQAAIMSETASAMGAALPGGQANAGQTAPNPSGAPSPQDPTQTGGGNVAPGAAPTPGQDGFSSNGGTGGGNQPAANQQKAQ